MAAAQLLARSGSCARRRLAALLYKGSYNETPMGRLAIEIIIKNIFVVFGITILIMIGVNIMIIK